VEEEEGHWEVEVEAAARLLWGVAGVLGGQMEEGS
jgi:hypothetical protein